MIEVRFRRLRPSDDLPSPVPATPGSAGADLPADIPPDAPCVLNPGEVRLVPTGLAIEIPAGFEGQVRPRSGLAARHGVTVLNSPGTVDSDYRGEVKVILINHGSDPYTVRRGDRIAQIVIASTPSVLFDERDELSATDRGQGGFGSTGV